MNHFQKNLENFCRDKDFSGVISIMRGQEPLLTQVMGYRDLYEKLPFNSETRLGIASGTKTFTALGIIKMIEQGFFDFKTKIHDLFKADLSFIHKDATIENLLCHTSGIFDYYDEELITDFDNFEVEIPWFKLETPKDYLPLFEKQQYKFLPGERFSYSNGGYIFLGIIIEKLSGQKFRDFIRTNVLTPAEMRSSGFYAFNSLPENTALGYVETDEGLISNIYKLPIRGASDGGMYTNVQDLNSFWASLFSHRIISNENLKKMTELITTFKSGSGYGMGIYTGKIEEYNCYSAIGGDAGVGFISRYIPEIKTSITIMSNRTDGEEGLMDYIIKEGYFV